MRVAFAGTPETALPALTALLESEHDVVAVLTQPDARAGRGRSLQASPVAQAAEAAGVPVFKPETLKDEAVQQHIASLNLDAVAVVAYGQLIPPAALNIPTHGWINLHFSLLPMWRGAAPVQHAILHGDDLTGASTFLIEAGLDTGPVFGTLSETIRPTDTAGELLERLAHAGAHLLVQTLDGVAAGALVAQPQPADGTSLAPKLSTEDGRIRWHDPSFGVDRRIRATTPSPGAWTTKDGERLRILEARDPQGQLPEALATRELAPGEVFATKKAIFVGTGTTALELLRVQAAGKKPMNAPDWYRGLRVEDTMYLGSD